MKRVRSQVHKLLKESQKKSKIRYDRRHETPKFKIGDLVLLKKPQHGNKLDDRWTGPFIIDNLTNNNLTVEIRHIKFNESQKVHVKRLMPFWNNSKMSWILNPPQICVVPIQSHLK